MIEEIKHFYENNSTMILIAIAISVLIVGFMMYQRMNNSSNISAFNGSGPSSTQFNKLSEMNCDMDSGLCYPEENIPQLSQGQDKDTIRKQMLLHQQMMMQQQQVMEQNQGQQQQQQQQQGNQQMSPEQEEQMMMQQQMMQQQMMQQQSENNGGQ